MYKVQALVLAIAISGVAGACSSSPGQRATQASAEACKEAWIELRATGVCVSGAHTNRHDANANAVQHNNWGALATFTYSLTLSTGLAGSYLVSPPPQEAERLMMQGNEFIRNNAKNWTPFNFREGIYYANFEIQSRPCISFLMDGPRRGHGSEWVLSGYFCRDGGADLAELRRMLAATRLGAPGRREVNVFGQALAPDARYRSVQS